MRRSPHSGDIEVGNGYGFDTEATYPGLLGGNSTPEALSHRIHKCDYYVSGSPCCSVL